jgi:hypothetical protein
VLDPVVASIDDVVAVSKLVDPEWATSLPLEATTVESPLAVASVGSVAVVESESVVPVLTKDPPVD